MRVIPDGAQRRSGIQRSPLDSGLAGMRPRPGMTGREPDMTGALHR